MSLFYHCRVQYLHAVYTLYISGPWESQPREGKTEYVDRNRHIKQCDVSQWQERHRGQVKMASEIDRGELVDACKSLISLRRK